MHHSTRRGFLGAAATSTALASLPAGVAAARNKKPGRYIESHHVEMHGHSLTPAYKQALTDHGIVAFRRIPVPHARNVPVSTGSSSGIGRVS